MAPKKLRAKFKSISTSTGTRQSKRLREQNDNILDSPKKLCYAPSSISLEKRDLRYCKVIEKQSVPTLKSLRVCSLDEDDKDANNTEDLEEDDKDTNNDKMYEE